MPRKSKRSPKHTNGPFRHAREFGEEQHRIDFEPESPKVRQMRAKARVRWGFHAAVCLLVLAALIALGRATVREAFVRNPRFSLRQVLVHTEGSLSPQKIVRQTGLTEGQNLLTVNLREVRARIEQLPEVRRATIARDYNGKLIIDVLQREPVAWLECQKQRLIPARSGFAWVTDAEGVAIPCDTIAEEYLRLPVIRMEDLPTVEAGLPVDARCLAFHAALRLLADFGRRFEDDEDEIAAIEIPKSYALVARFRGGAEVTFGIDDLDAQLARYDRIKREARERNWQIATLNLLAQTNIPITFKNLAAAPVASAVRPEPAGMIAGGRSRRNHPTP